ncbi:unnamed protein product [Sphagnum troendelagicum]|uniref:PIN-like protein n=1 Tax=Sphagnum troendelagicum TaxID=128251 RepID=A0ABP0U222_9BRYO
MVSWSHVVPMATSICSSVVVGVEAPCCFQLSAASHQLLIKRRRRRRRRSPIKGNCHSFHFQALRVVANCEAGEAAGGGPGGGDWGERKELGVVRNRPWVWRCVATTGAILVVQAIAGGAGDQDVANAIVTNYRIAAAQPMEFGVSLLPENEGFSSCLPASSAPELLHSSAAGGVRRIGPGKLSHGKQQQQQQQQLTPVVVGTSRRVVSRKQVFGGYHIVKGGVGGGGGGAAAPLLLNSNGLGGCNSMSSFPIASVSASLMSSMTRIVKAGSHLDLNVLGASLGSSIKIISLCTFVVWMQRTGQLPADTPVVLSQVAFRVLIPCFLMSKVSLTLASHPSASLLALPLIAIAQVFVGALLGKVACRIVFGKPSSPRPLSVETALPAAPAPAALITTTAIKGGGLKSLPEAPPPPPPLHMVLPTSTSWIAAEQHKATKKKEAIITAACAFGNSLTLPLVFMTGVLAADELNQAAGYLALFMVGWTPALWTVGYRIIASGDADEDSRGNATRQGLSWLTVADWFESIMNPPLYGVLVGVLVGGTPLSQFCLPIVAESAVGVEATTGAVMMLRSVAAGILRPIFDAATLLGTATMAVQTVVLASSLAASMPSLKAKGSSSPNKTSTTSGVVGNPLKDALRTTDASAGARPEPLLDRRAFWIISSVRLIAMPVVGIIMITALQCARVLPVDPIFNLTVLAEAAMPSAQNLVLLSQLRASTQPLAGMLANLLLSQYALSVVPITLWMAVFLTLVRGS